MTRYPSPLPFRTRALAANFEKAVSYEPADRRGLDAHDRPPHPGTMTLFELIDYAARGCRVCERELAARARLGARH